MQLTTTKLILQSPGRCLGACSLKNTTLVYTTLSLSHFLAFPHILFAGNILAHPPSCLFLATSYATLWPELLNITSLTLLD